MEWVRNITFFCTYSYSTFTNDINKKSRETTSNLRMQPCAMPKKAKSLPPRYLLPGSLADRTNMALPPGRTSLSTRIKLIPPTKPNNCMEMLPNATVEEKTVDDSSPLLPQVVSASDLAKDLTTQKAANIPVCGPPNVELLDPAISSQINAKVVPEDINLNHATSPGAQSSFASCLISPAPNLSFSPLVRDETTLPLLRALYELHESEIAYVDSLKVLSNTYLDDVYPARLSNDAVPIILLKQLLERMLAAHSTIANGLWDILRSKTLSVSQMTVLASRLVVKKGTTSFYYEEYCNNYSMAMRILTNNELPPNKNSLTNDEILIALRNYLELTQPVALKGDLSLTSLALRPLMRIPKYRLLLELMERRLNNEAASKAVRYYLESVKAALKQINDSGRLQKQRVVTEIGPLFGRARFIGDTKLTLDYFGVPQFVGALTVVWVEDSNRVKNADMACILFKSHLMCCDLHLFAMFGRRKHLKVRFLIPLSRCKLCLRSEEIENGLNTIFPYTIKLEIEVGYLHYEVMLVCLTKREHLLWGQHLATFVNEVNGPYELDFSKQDSPQITILPDKIVPSDLFLNDTKTYQENKLNCYFKLPIAVSVVLGFCNVGEHVDPVFAGYINLANTAGFQLEKATVVIRRTTREGLEKMLFHHWSKELPRYFIPSCNQIQLNNNNGCEKSSASAMVIETPSLYSESILPTPEIPLDHGRIPRSSSLELELLANAKVDVQLARLHGF